MEEQNEKSWWKRFWWISPLAVTICAISLALILLLQDGSCVGTRVNAPTREDLSAQMTTAENVAAQTTESEGNTEPQTIIEVTTAEEATEETQPQTEASTEAPTEKPTPKPTEASTEATSGSTPSGSKNGSAKLVSEGGALRVSGTDLVDKNGKYIQLRGVSTMGLQWFPQYVNYDAFKTLRDDWGANLVRLAMYTHEGGYCSGANKEGLENLIDEGVKAATDLSMYVIIDWHVLNERSPLTYQSQAEAFFKKMAKKYANHNNVIYEICNEPNGTPWADVKKYAEKIVPIIREYDKNAIIVIGTPTWSQLDGMESGNDLPKIDQKNIMYTCHFYAATHKDDLRNKVRTAIKNGVPVFITEFSICDASGNGGIDYTSATEWANLIKEYNLSYAGWSLCNKNETSALISPGCSKTSGWATSELSETGKWLRQLISGGAPDYSGSGNAGNSGGGNGGGQNPTQAPTQPQTQPPTTEKVGGTFQFKVKITNTSNKTINPWKVTATLPKGCSMQNGWGSTATISKTTLTLKPGPDASEGWTGSLSLEPGASFEGIGLQISCPSTMKSFTVENNGIKAEFTMENSW